VEQRDVEKQLVLRGRPESPWIMRQRWGELLFLHWEWEESDLQRRLPEGLLVQKFGGKAYLGLVPFFMSGVRPRFVPAIPGISDFLELNLRTYVTDRDGQPGVWFYSLDCNQPLAVWTARTFFHLAYRNAQMTAKGSPEQGWRYYCQREGEKEMMQLDYRLGSGRAEAVPGSLDFFLIERYLLFSSFEMSGSLGQGRVWHRPYALSPVEHRGDPGPAFRAERFAPPGRPPDHAVGSPGVDVWIHPLKRLEAKSLSG
jgi:uncharacterized protein